VLVLGDAGGEQFDLDVRLGHAGFLQGLGHAQHHVFRAADEGDVDVVGAHPVLQELRRLFLGDAAVEQFDVLLLAAHHVGQLEALHIAVLQVRQLVLEDHRGRRAVAVEEREAAVRFGRQRGLDDREDGRDAAAGRKGQIVLAVGGVQRDVEVAHGRHHVERDAGLERVVGPAGEQAALGALDGDAQRAFLHRRADRVRAAHVFVADQRAQRQVLALLVSETVLQLGRHGEGDGDGVARFVAHLGDGQRMEFAHGLVSGT
jgi:hypothetical protein